MTFFPESESFTIHIPLRKRLKKCNGSCVNSDKACCFRWAKIFGGILDGFITDSSPLCLPPRE